MKVGLLTLDLVGPIRNGGIGTAFTALAEWLAAEGHEVTVVFPAAFTETLPLPHWVRHYAAKGIRLDCLGLEGTEPFLSLAAARHAASLDLDVLHVHEWRGIGFFAAAARRAGRALRDTAVVCQMHSPTAWHRDHSQDFAPGPQAAAVSFMERRSAEMADLVFSPSRYLLGWAAEAGWRVPATARVHPNLLPAGFAALPPAPAAPAEEPVFFGRLEERKGLDLFCAALTRLVREGRPPRRAAFLGKLGEVAGEDALSFIARAARDWPFPWEVRNELDVAGARDFLRGAGRFAVIASAAENSPYTVLECLHAGTPFLAADVGGIPELVAPADRPRVLFPRDAASLAARLAAVLGAPLPPARPATPEDAARDAWAALHRDALALRRRAPAAPAARPTVSVVVATHERPTLLPRAVASLEAQTWPETEIVVVDDASQGAGARAALDALAPRLAARGHRLLRLPENRYLGAARNAGAAAARGEFLAFLDDDNVAYPHMVEALLGAARHAGAPVVTCQLHNFAGDGPGPALAQPMPNGWIPLGGPVELGLIENPFGDAGFLVRRDVFAALEGFREDRAGFEDWEFLLRAALAGHEILCLPEALYHYRVNPAAMLRGMGRPQAWRSHARIARAWAGEAARPDLVRALALAADLLVGPRYPAGGLDGRALNAAPGFAGLARRLAREGRAEQAALLLDQAARLAPHDAALALERLLLPGATAADAARAAALLAGEDAALAAPVLAALREAGRHDLLAALEPR